MKRTILSVTIASVPLFFPGCKKSTSEMSEEARDAISQAEESINAASDSLSSMKERVTKLQETIRRESARLSKVADEQIEVREKQLREYQGRLDQVPPTARPEAAALVEEMRSALDEAKIQARKFAAAPPLDNQPQSEDLSDLLDRIDRKARELRAKLGER